MFFVHKNELEFCLAKGFTSSVEVDETEKALFAWLDNHRAIEYA